jgi:hypothetical protein
LPLPLRDGRLDSRTLERILAFFDSWAFDTPAHLEEAARPKYKLET